MDKTIVTTQKTYIKPKGKIVVNSYFTNETPISELIYQILSKTLTVKTA